MPIVNAQRRVMKATKATSVILGVEEAKMLEHRVAEIFLSTGEKLSHSLYIRSLIRKDWEKTRNQGAIARKVDLNTEGLGGK